MISRYSHYVQCILVVKQKHNHTHTSSRIHKQPHTNTYINEYFSSVFTREDISTLPVLETKFEGSDYLGQVIVTTKIIALQIRDMKLINH